LDVVLQNEASASAQDDKMMASTKVENSVL
jgi:hypothetical protein